MSTGYQMSDEELQAIVDQNTPKPSCTAWIVATVVGFLLFFIAVGVAIYLKVKTPQAPTTIVPPISKLGSTSISPSVLTKV